MSKYVITYEDNYPWKYCADAILADTYDEAIRQFVGKWREAPKIVAVVKMETGNE